MADAKYFEGIGRRKRAIARVRVMDGTGKVIVNDFAPHEYFPTETYALKVFEPIKALGKEKKVDITIKVSGGGKSAQADAVKMGVARALVLMDEAVHTTLAKLGLLKRDPREKERKKYGLKRARKAPQFTKR